MENTIKSKVNTKQNVWQSDEQETSIKSEDNMAEDENNEAFKIEIRNLGYFAIGEIRKLLRAKLDMEVGRIKSHGVKNVCYIYAGNKKDQERAIQFLDGYKMRTKVLQAAVAKPLPVLLTKKHKKRSWTDCSEGSEPKKPKTLEDSICPWASIPYEDQLERKSKKVELIFKECIDKLKHLNPELEKVVTSFQYIGLEPSPQINGYRNKCELTIGKNEDGEIVVGFRVSTYISTTLVVKEIEALPHIPDEAKWAAKTFQEFVRSKSDTFLPFNPEDSTGHFRHLGVRVSAHTGEIMLIVGIVSSNIIQTDLFELKQDIKSFYDNYDASSKYKCTSLYYQDLKNRDAGRTDCPVELLSGTTHIIERVCDLEFRIDPMTFFQTNSKLASSLYQKIIELAAPQPHSTVLDICCGIGTVALTFANHCKQVLGVDIIPEAVTDAKLNAKLNYIKNCKFYTGSTDSHVESMIEEAVKDNSANNTLDLIAVVDPPRGGLSNRTIAALRAAPDIKRLIYISCYPERAQKNWNDLGRSSTEQFKGNPFYLKTAIAFDMFPHTQHSELIILFERVKTTCN